MLKLKYIMFKRVLLIILGLVVSEANILASKSALSQLVVSEASLNAAVPVEVARVKKRDINAFLLINCTIEAEKQVDIMTKTSGQVKEILVEEGQQAAEGQALAKLDETESLLALKEARIRHENAKMIYERSKRTYEEKIASKEQLDESRLQYETSMVDYERKNLEYTYSTITSPIDGTIVNRAIEVGSVVEKNQKVFTVADFNPLLARIHVPEKDLSKIKEGQPSIIAIESLPGLQFNGRVKMISPVIDPESGTLKVTVEIEYAEGSPLRPGMFASVYTITERHANALIIPKKALLFESESAAVFVVKDSSAYKTKVRLGFSEVNEVEVISGLNEGDVIVTVGQEDLGDGAAVTIVAEAEASETPINKTKTTVSFKQ